MDAAQLHAVLQQLGSTALAQQKQAEQQQAVLAAFLEQRAAPGVAASSTSSSAPSPRFDVKLPALALYDGRGSIEPWLMAIRQRVAWYSASAPLPEAQRVALAAQHLSHAALSWWDSLGGQIPVTYDAFVLALKKQFQHVDTEMEARQKLLQLRQGAKQSVQDYAVEFRQLQVALPDELDKTRAFAFLQGLRPHLRGLVNSQASRDPSLAATIELAARLEANQQWAASMSSGSPSRDPNAMDLDHMEDQASSAPAWKQEMLAAMRQEFAQWRGGGRGDAPGAKSRSSKIPGVSKEQIAERRKAGSCFQCGEKGHQIRDCPASN